MQIIQTTLTSCAGSCDAVVDKEELTDTATSIQQEPQKGEQANERRR
ncbi:MAG: hypothetical protein SNJ69_11645 [Chloroflexaceae bacterium]